MPREINAICTNRLGKVRMCKRLLTPMNFRRLYLRLDYALPRNLLMALTLDVSDNRLRTLEADNVIKYYYAAGTYLRASMSSAEDELLDSDLAVRWLMNAIQIMGELHKCTGQTTMAQAIDDKYHRDLDVNRETLGAMIYRTLPNMMEDVSREDALSALRRVAEIVKPTNIRIWGIDNDGLAHDERVPKYTENVFLGEARTNEVRSYPLNEKISYIKDVDP